MGIPGKGLITSLGIKTIRMSKKYRKTRYAITNVSLKGISKIIKEFEKFPFGGYVRNKPKHELTDSYFYLARHIDKCMMRSGAFSLHIDPVKTKMTGMQQITTLRICDTDRSESEGIIVDKQLLRVYSADDIKSESNIVDESSKRESKSEIIQKSININKVKYAIDET